MKFEIKHSISGEVLFSLECGSLKLCVEAAVKSRADLSGAYLSGANLYGADLSGAYLSGANLYGADLSRAYLSRANLSGADLYGADLSGAYLSRADLSGAYLSRADLSRADLSRANLSRAYLSRANLSGANLSGANLSRANLSRADLSGANLSRADLSGANLSGANLYGADLSGANLYGADLYGADLYGAKNAELAIAKTRILPEGDLIGWKKLEGGVIAKLRIPADAKRSHAFGRKCRAEYAVVLEGTGASQHDKVFHYSPGETVRCHNWDDNWQNECSGGIHFFITKEEAENY